MQQNKTPEKITQVCIVSKDVVQHFTNKNKLLNSSVQRKLLQQTESSAVQSVEVYSQSGLIAILSNYVVSLPYSQKAQMSHVLSDISCQMELCLLYKEFHNCI